MRQRTITAFFFTLVMLGGIYGGAHTFFALFAFICAGCAWELGNMMFREEDRFFVLRKIMVTVLTTTFFIAIAGNELSYFQVSSLSTQAIACLFFPVLAATELFMAGKKPFPNLGTYLLSLFYIGVPLVLLTSIAHDDIYAPNRVLGLLLLVWTNDVGAYLLGSRLGKNKLLERISPKKTWEGTLGGAIFAVLGAWGLSFFISDFSLPQWLALSVVAAIGSNIGDLVESMLKRSVGVKDSGTLLPGHGGLLDRFDAFIFCLPFYWLVLQVV